MKTATNYSEETLQQELAAGSKQAFEIIYKKHFVSIYQFAKRFVDDEQGAEDITTEVFIKLWERIASFNNLSAIKSFLFTSTKNACINYNRSDQRATARHQEFVYLLTTGTEEQIEIEQIPAKVYQHIYDEIENLPAQEKKVFKMAFIEGLTNETIAEQLGINNQSVRNHKSRALKTLRLKLQDKDAFTYLLFVLLLNKLKYIICAN